MSDEPLDYKGRPLNLREPAATAAKLLAADFPEITFTSGRRTLEDQASAMAANCASRITSTKRHAAGSEWIRATYRQSAVRDALIAWLDAHPRAYSRMSIAAGFIWVLRGFSPDEAAKISRHLGGLAFDISPVHGDLGRKIRERIATLPGLDKFLDHEGGLERWHVQTFPVPE